MDGNASNGQENYNFLLQIIRNLDTFNCLQQILKLSISIQNNTLIYLIGFFLDNYLNTEKFTYFTILHMSLMQVY
jgi:hypothetical protein